MSSSHIPPINKKAQKGAGRMGNLEKKKGVVGVLDRAASAAAVLSLSLSLRLSPYCDSYGQADRLEANELGK